MFISVDAQTRHRKDSPQSLFSKQLFLKVNKNKAAPVTLKTRNVSVSEITAELSKHYNFPFALSGSIANYKPAINVASGTLENIFQKLAPFVVIEKEMSGGAKSPVITGVYMYAYNENIPSMKDGRSVSFIQSFIFEGSTETATVHENIPQSPVVKYENERLSVRSQKESLILIVGKIAEKLGTPLTVLSKSDSVLTVNFSSLKPEEAFRYFPPNVILKYQIFLDKNQTVFNQVIVQ